MHTRQHDDTSAKVPESGISLFGRRLSREMLGRVGRYLGTSAVATLASEIALVLLYGRGVLGATAAAVAANFVGAVPSYLLSRYWIWPSADRRRPTRQVVVYLMTSVVSLVVSTAGTTLAASLAPGPHALHVSIVALSYIACYGLLWVAKFGFYHKILFRAAEMRDLEAGRSIAA